MYVITGRTGGGRQLSHLHLPTERAKNEVWLRGASADHRHVGGRSNYVVFALQIQEVCHATELRMSVCGALQRARFLLTYLIFLINTIMCCVQSWFDSQLQDFYQVINTTQTWQWWFVCSWRNSWKPSPCSTKANSHTDYVSLRFHLSHICT